MKTVSVLIACGGGIATSSYAAAEIEKIAQSVGVKVKVRKDQLFNVPVNAKNYDLCCVTSKFNKDLETKLIQVGGLITGINEEKVRKQISDALVELAQD